MHLETAMGQCGQLSSYDKKELENHIDIEHAVDGSSIYPNSSVEWECP